MSTGRRASVLRLCSVFQSDSVTGRARHFDAVGGMQSHTAQLTRHLDALGVPQTVLTAWRPDVPRPASTRIFWMRHVLIRCRPSPDRGSSSSAGLCGRRGSRSWSTPWPAWTRSEVGWCSSGTVLPARRSSVGSHRRVSPTAPPSWARCRTGTCPRTCSTPTCSSFLRSTRSWRRSCSRRCTWGQPSWPPGSVGVPDVVRDGHNGRLVPPGAPDSLAATIADLLADPGLRQRLVTAARIESDDYCWDVLAQRMLAVYREVLR